MRTTPILFGLFSATALFGAVAACSSTTTTTSAGAEDAGSGDGSSTKDTGTKDTGSKTEVDSGDTTTDPDTKCAEETTQEACGNCCVTAHQAGYKSFLSIVTACTCDGTGAADGGVAPCADDCKDTFCAATPKQPDTACDKCLQAAVGTGGACQQEVSTKCTADKECLASQNCIAPCAKKP